jgi:hypothetical protein
MTPFGSAAGPIPPADMYTLPSGPCPAQTWAGGASGQLLGQHVGHTGPVNCQALHGHPPVQQLTHHFFILETLLHMLSLSCTGVGWWCQRAAAGATCRPHRPHQLPSPRRQPLVQRLPGRHHPHVGRTAALVWQQLRIDGIPSCILRGSSGSISSSTWWRPRWQQCGTGL